MTITKDFAKWCFLVTLTTLTLLLPLAGCVDFFGDRFEAQVKAGRASTPYYGTGVVTALRVERWGEGEAVLNFGSSTPPPYYTPLLIVRSNLIVARVSMKQSPTATVLKGSLQIGDLAIGWQRADEFTRRSNTPLQPTAVRSQW